MDAQWGQDVPEVSYPSLLARAASVEAFVPKGWAVEQRVDADFNADAKPDAVLVVRMKDKRNVLGELDTNPRLLVAVLADGKDFKLAAVDHAVIPRHGNPNVDDPFTSLSSSKGGFLIELHSFASAGTWWAGNTKLRFRYEGGCFRLIGYDAESFHRASGQTEATSVNLLTGKAELTTKENEEARPVVEKKKRTPNPPVCLEQVGDGFAFSPLDQRAQ